MQVQQSHKFHITISNTYYNIIILCKTEQGFIQDCWFFMQEGEIRHVSVLEYYVQFRNSTTATSGGAKFLSSPPSKQIS